MKRIKTLETRDLCESAIVKKGKFRSFLFRQKGTIADASKFSVMYCICIVFSVLIKLLINHIKIDINSEFLFYLIILIVPVTSLLTSIGKSFGQSIYDKCGDLLDTHIFVISKGDKKENERIEERSKYSKEIFWFIANTIISLIMSFAFFIVD